MSSKKEFFLLVDAEKDTEGKRFLEINTKVVSFASGGIKEKLTFFCKSIDCSTIDILAYNPTIDLILDDEGLFVSGNPVFEFPNGLQVVGSFLVGRQVMTEEGIETVGFPSREALLEQIQKDKFSYKVIGITR
ncbi:MULTISPECIES: hypothetical protein [Bacillaceae]|uniref:hypothetical protein n=1 Tax=Bacillaceae TaxID=186817 RepID=UPI0005A932BE|nr:hypothetical protein [Bacillus rubiinfantis]